MIQLSNFYFYIFSSSIHLFLLFYFAKKGFLSLDEIPVFISKRPADKKEKERNERIGNETHEIISAAAWRFDPFCLPALMTVFVELYGSSCPLILCF